MENTFVVDGVEYKIVRNPYTHGPMIARVDGFPIENRKEICRRFLRLHGWTDEMFGSRITNELERQINRIINGRDPLLNSNNASRRHNISHREKTYSYRVINEKINLAEHVNKFTEVYHSDVNGRYLSYDHIRRAFLSLRKEESNRDLLTLHLYAYLASWGMLRNSFLMQKDYKFLAPVVDIICNSKYESIINYDPFKDIGSDKARLIMDIVNEIRQYFIGQTYFEEGSRKLKTIDSVSDTLVTKILLGTLGCTVAYDTYVRKGLSNHNLKQKICVASVLELRSFAQANKEEIEHLLLELNELYTPMKIIDMFFFEEGFTL